MYTEAGRVPKIYVFGVTYVTASSPDRTQRYLTAHTRVSSYLDWISLNTGIAIQP